MTIQERYREFLLEEGLPNTMAIVPGCRFETLLMEWLEKVFREKDAEIAKLRKVAVGVQRLRQAVFASDIRDAWQDIIDALAELDGGNHG